MYTNMYIYRKVWNPIFPNLDSLIWRDLMSMTFGKHVKLKSYGFNLLKS